MPIVRPAQPNDLDEILEINQAHLPAVSSLDAAALQQLAAWSQHFEVAENGDGRVVGFILSLGPGQPYASLNYRWFAERYRSFLYIDRVAIAETAQRQGLGQTFYANALEAARAQKAPLLCEVNIVPRNEASLAFHARLGFTSVGEQNTDGNNKRVTMLERVPYTPGHLGKRLPSG